MEVSWISVFPFVLLLLSIAVLPFIVHAWWEKYYFYVSLFAALVTSVYFLVIGKGWDIFYSIEEYIKFISLLTSLFVISGGIFIGLRGYATPFRNVLFLFFGAVLSNVIGTTGASMLLIRPFIKSNRKEKAKTFFSIPSSFASRGGYGTVSKILFLIPSRKSCLCLAV